ncbi:MAG: type II glyceraldehyde-3-phosphate dehydrogenase [Methanobacteriota archaeon]|nr:MAG: type II glyceraldehyde-3-phosphate dehydrogenase [Euryarchaeota archaeon]
MIRVAVNGYGTIGKRVADAINLQEDMEIVGVTKTKPTFEALEAKRRGYPLYTLPDRVELFNKSGVKVEGTLEELLQKADIVVDCTPSGIGEKYKPLYQKLGIKAIYQGGEPSNVAEASFNALANYAEAIGKRHVRVVSCNTTGLCRTLYPLKQKFGIKNVKAVMIRRASDPANTKTGPINAIEPTLHVPSHHGPDVQTIIPDLNITTMAVKVPTTLMHVHSVIVNLEKPVTAEEVTNLWLETPRVILVESGRGLKSTAQLIEMARDMGRPRSDLWEIVVWRDGIHVEGNTLYYYQGVHQEANVVPENVDAVRAMLGVERNNLRSIAKTDKAMGIIQGGGTG